MIMEGKFSYEPPSGFYALNTKKLQHLWIGYNMAFSAITNPTSHFNTKLYTGTNSSNAQTGVGFQPDWLWFKRRD